VIEFIYEGKCNNCGRLNPRMAIPVLEDKGDGAHTARFWCFDCVKLYSTQVYNGSLRKNYCVQDLLLRRTIYSYFE
jgi:hypothetical protein